MSTLQPSASMVMDLSPWPDCQGFQGTDEWWRYVLDMDEKKRLDNLLGAALLKVDIRQRLVWDRDEALFNEYGLSEPTKQWLRSVKAKTLTEFAQAIVHDYRQIA